MDDTDTIGRVGPGQETKSKENDSLTMVIVNLVKAYDTVRAIMRGDDNEFLFKTSRDMYKDPMALGCLRHRKDCLEHKPFDDRGHWTRTDDADSISVAASVLDIRSAYIYFILQRSCILFDAVCLANIRSPTPIQLLPPVHAPVTPTPPRAPSQTPLPSPSPVPASSPRLPSNKDTAEDRKTPDDSAPSHSFSPSAVPTSVTPLQDTRQVLAIDPNPFEVPLPVLPFDLDMFSLTATPATDSSRYSLKPGTECEDFYPIPANHLVRSQAR